MTLKSGAIPCHPWREIAELPHRDYVKRDDDAILLVKEWLPHLRGIASLSPKESLNIFSPKELAGRATLADFAAQPRALGSAPGSCRCFLAHFNRKLTSQPLEPVLNNPSSIMSHLQGGPQTCFEQARWIFERLVDRRCTFTAAPSASSS